MNNEISNSYGLGKAIHKQVTDPKGDSVGLADAALDWTTGMIDATPIGEVINRPVKAIEASCISRIERTKIVESVKQKFSTHISKAAAQSLHSFTMPNVLSADRALLKGKSGQEFMDTTKSVYDKHQQSRFYRFQRKMHDQARVLKKNPVKIAKLPLGLVPGGDIAKTAIKGAEYVGGKFAGARKQRKKGEYASGNKAVLEQRLGTKEAARKISKWQAKDIAELGPKLQRNLYKLKQSVAVLDSRHSDIEAKVNRFNSAPTVEAEYAALAQVARSREELAMSYHEAQHYIEKVKGMCSTLEATAIETNAYLHFLEELLEQTQTSILNSIK